MRIHDLIRDLSLGTSRYPEGEGNRFLPNAGTCIRNDTAPHPTRNNLHRREISALISGTDPSRVQSVPLRLLGDSHSSRSSTLLQIQTNIVVSFVSSILCQVLVAEL
jgi:hypothetical protein